MMHLPRRAARTHDTGAVPSWVPDHEWQRPELVIWGAHGGAGTTTLATWLQPAWDMGAMRTEPDPPYPDAVARGRVLLVACRNTAIAARQADLIETWLDYKRANELDPIRLRPTPHEFEMYYDV
jgi:hypothetical protein